MSSDNTLTETTQVENVHTELPTMPMVGYDSPTPSYNDALTEYHVTSGIDVSEVDDFDEKILESDTFQWRELSDMSPQSKSEESDDDMPPLIPASDSSDGSDSSDVSDGSDGSDSSYESNTEHDEGDSEQDPVPNPPPHSIPSLIPGLSILLFILHLIYHAHLVYEKHEREKNPCFLMKW